LKENQTIYQTILKKKPIPLLPSHIPNLSVVASHILLSETDVELTMAMDHREARLKTRLDEIKDQFDHVIIDCPPALGWLTVNAFTASDQILIVVSPGYFELDSIVQISKSIEQVRHYFNPQLMIAGILFTMSDPTINTKTSLKILRQTYTQDVLNTIIPRNTEMRDAHFNKQDIFSFNPHSKSAEAYSRLIQELKL